MRKNYFTGLLVWVLFLSGVPAIGFAQSTGTLRGKVTLETTGNPIHNVIITIFGSIARPRRMTTEFTNFKTYRRAPMKS